MHADQIIMVLAFVMAVGAALFVVSLIGAKFINWLYGTTGEGP